jgi:hypothetical protein
LTTTTSTTATPQATSSARSDRATLVRLIARPR